MSEHGHTSFEARLLLNAFGNQFADAAKLHRIGPLLVHLFYTDISTKGSCPFRHTQDAELCSLAPLQDCFEHLVPMERDFRNEDDICAAGNTRTEGNPSGVASHRFNDNHAVMCRGGCLKAVDRFRGNCAGGVMAECNIRCVEIIIDSLWHADHIESHLKQLVGDDLGPISPNRD